MKIPFSRSLSLLLLVVIFLTTSGAAHAEKMTDATSPSSSAVPSLGTEPANPTCHFSVGTALGVNGYDIQSLGVGSYLDWGRYRSISVPASINYNRVLRLSDAEFTNTLNGLDALIPSNKGVVWIIGNEPDSEVTYQDHVSAQVYAERYYAIATRIRLLDSTAKLGFGAVIEPTAIRMHYLSLALDRLTQLAGSKPAALALIDVYTIHAFILNEQPIYDPATGKNVSWGAGVPIGYDANTWPAPYVIDLGNGEVTKVHDITIFENRIVAFRQWMQSLGDQNKPLWVTEYGVLFPSVDIGFEIISEADTIAFMEASFDYMLGTKDPNLGYSLDQNRLVQQWVWYSLNDYLTHFGGSLYNPLNHQMTDLGKHFMNYNPSEAAVPMVNPDMYVVGGGLTATPIYHDPVSGQFGYQITVRVGNKISSDRLTNATVDLYDGTQLIGTAPVQIARCAGTGVAIFTVKGTAGNQYTFKSHVSVVSGNGTDVDPSNNDLTYPPVTLSNAYFQYVPLSMHK